MEMNEAAPLPKRESGGVLKRSGPEITSLKMTGNPSAPKKKDRSLELKSLYHECLPGRRKLVVKVVDIFGNDSMKIVEVTVGGKK